MSCDLFNNNTGNYVNPGLAPCAGAGEGDVIEFVEDGIGVVNGSEIKARVDFGDLKIPTSSWNQQIQTVGPGEVVFIQGLTKGLSNGVQGYKLPSLVSTNEDLNPYFMDIDLSVNYYKNFSYVMDAVDASSDYATNIDIATALNNSYGTKGIKINTTYDSSLLSFTGTALGYEFNVSSVVLNVIDASQDINSPFPAYIVNGERVPQTYTLVEDASVKIPAVKYPNTAMQGIIMKVKFPSSVTSGTICESDKWVYVNHAQTDVTLCEPIELNFNTEVSSNLIIEFDGSAFLGIKPIITDDVSIADVSSNYDPSIADIVIVDGSTTILGLVIDNSTLTNYVILDSSITDSSISAPNSLYDGYISGSRLNSDTYYSGALIEQSYLNGVGVLSSELANNPEITDTKVEDSTITDSSIFGTLTSLVRTDVSGGYFEGIANGSGDPSAYNYFGDILLGDTTDLTLEFYNIQNLDLDASPGGILKAGHSVLDGITGGDNTINISDSSAYNITGGVAAYNSLIESGTLFQIIGDQVEINDSSISGTTGSSIKDSKISNSLISPDNSLGPLLNVQDSSIINSSGTILADQSDIIDSSLYGSVITNSAMVTSIITDSSIDNGIFNEATTVTNSVMTNSWSNVYVLVTNPSTGDKIYIIDDDTLPTASEAWRNEFTNTEIWDSSLNNVTIYDSSIYRTFLKDVSLYGCTTYNCILENSVDVDTRSILIEASIYCDVSIASDVSTYYEKVHKTLNVGMNGCSTDDVMSAGDYLNWITETNQWNRVGEMYTWMTAPDDVNTTNLIPGFYVYNEHDFSVSLDYLVFV